MFRNLIFADSEMLAYLILSMGFSESYKDPSLIHNTWEDSDCIVLTNKDYIPNFLNQIASALSVRIITLDEYRSNAINSCKNLYLHSFCAYRLALDDISSVIYDRLYIYSDGIKFSYLYKADGQYEN